VIFSAYTSYRRVRHDLAKNFSPVSAGLGFHFHSATAARLSELFLCYVALLQDMEAEVRHSAVTNVAYMTYLGGSDLFMQHIAPLLPALAADPVMEVRSKLAQAMMDCVGSDDAEDGLGERPLPDNIILEVLRPLLEGFLNDEFAEVQLHVLNKLSRVAHLFSKMDVVVNAIMVMTKAHNWRVRESVASLLPHLAEAMGVDFFKEQLLDAWMKLLMDQVCQVRMSCVAGMAQLLNVGGANWMQKELLTLYKQLYNDNADTYLTRITILRCYGALSGAAKTLSQSSSLKEETMNMLLTALEDPVANVRLVASKGLTDFAKLLENDSVVGSKIKPALQARVANDDDADVRFFSELALEMC
jgi:serine/threonine-protein phosphatase 2A regulatory subunit A